MATTVATRIDDVRRKISQACDEVDRDAADVELIAVSKTFGAKVIRPVLDAGQRIFGENRVQEAQGKWPELKSMFPDAQVHLIGPLQSNKTGDAVALFDAIHSIDRPKIARTIGEEMSRQGRKLELFIQVNTGEEPQKAGIAPPDLAQFLEVCRGECGLTIDGLMCIPPIAEAPAPHFELLRSLAQDNDLKRLSMGMSADFATAVQFGAHYVRVGSAIFGARA